MSPKSILILVFILLTGCAPDLPKDPATLVWHFPAEPDTLNPLTSTDVYASRVQAFVYDTLIERDNRTLEWKPKMASDWQISADRLQLTFTLREGILWHDGRPVTVDDIVYSFERIMDPKVDAPHLRVYYQDILRVEKLDARRVRFTYRRPYFMALEFCGGIPIIPKHLFDNGEDFNRHSQNRAPIGMGPYRFDRWETGKKVVLVRNEDYWGKSIGKFPEIEKIVFQVISEDTVALQVLKKGGLDLASLRPIQWVRQTDSAKFSGRFRKVRFYSPSYSYIGWNQTKAIFKEAKIRRALSMLVNRGEILEKLEFGLGRMVTGPFYVESPSYDQGLPQIRYDPSSARALLMEAGWEDHNGDGILDRAGVPFRFELLIPAGRRFSERLATILKEDFRKVGIGMEIRTLEWAVYTRHLDDRKFEAVTLGWSFGIEQDPYQVWHSTQAGKGSNFVGYKNPEVDRLIEQARAEFDSKRRSALYREIHRLIYEDQPYTFLFSFPNLVALHRRFENVTIYPTGIEPLEWTVAQGTE